MTIKELIQEVATSLYLEPCTREDLGKREFLTNISNYGIDYALRSLHIKGALYIKSDKFYIYKKWAKKNLENV